MSIRRCSDEFAPLSAVKNICVKTMHRIFPWVKLKKQNKTVKYANFHPGQNTGLVES